MGYFYGRLPGQRISVKCEQASVAKLVEHYRYLIAHLLNLRQLCPPACIGRYSRVTLFFTQSHQTQKQLAGCCLLIWREGIKNLIGPAGQGAGDTANCCICLACHYPLPAAGKQLGQGVLEEWQ